MYIILRFRRRVVYTICQNHSVLKLLYSPLYIYITLYRGTHIENIGTYINFPDKHIKIYSGSLLFFGLPPQVSSSHRIAYTLELFFLVVVVVECVYKRFVFVLNDETRVCKIVLPATKSVYIDINALRWYYYTNPFDIVCTNIHSFNTYRYFIWPIINAHSAVPSKTIICGSPDMFNIPQFSANITVLLLLLLPLYSFPAVVLVAVFRTNIG